MDSKRILLFACVVLMIQLLKRSHADVSLGYRRHPGYRSAGARYLHAPIGQFGGVYHQHHQHSVPNSGSYYNNYYGGASNGGGSYGGSIGGSFGGGSFGSGSFGGGASNGGGYSGSIGGSFVGSAVDTGFTGQTSYQTDEQQYHGTSNAVEEEQHIGGGGGPHVSKHFYVFSAPVDHEQQEVVRHIKIGSPHTNYRVVFINAPSQTHSKAKVVAHVAPNQEKTAIYVLSKSAHDLDVQTELGTAPHTHDSKPEVFFIKYKNAAEAIHAQQTIQAQFDALGGSSVTTNEGVAPVSSVVGSLGHSDASANVNFGNGGGGNPAYLPNRQK